MDTAPSTLNTRKRKPAAQNGGERDPDFWPLTDKPYFHAVLKKPNLAKTFRVTIPRNVSQNLPVAKIPAKVVYRGKVWDLTYLGNQGPTNCRFENKSWEKFVDDNNLVGGDACVFELMEGRPNSTSIKFRLQVLKGEFPTELIEKAEGTTPNNPIDLCF